MRIAYLISEYPKVSHSFIRREIVALERLGVEVQRFAIRGPSDGSPDAADIQERRRTRYVLGAGALAMIAHALRRLVKNPARFAGATRSALRLSRRAEPGVVHHLAYLVDARVGERVNYGAGSITANYDGANKHRTVIEADVHVGSNCVLVAPVTIGAGGTVGAGSTITKSTEPGALAVARGRQASIANWQRPQKQKKAG